MTDLRGVLPITLTPFTDDGSVDESSIDTLVEDYLAAGAHGLTILGIMGEFHKLTEAERERVTAVVLEQAAGRLPVIVGTTHDATDVVMRLSRAAREAGAAGIMVASPHGVRGEAALLAHFRQVAASVDLPLVVQDEPVTTGVLMPPALLAHLAAEIPTLVAIKLEEAPSPQKLSQVLALTGDRVRVFGGLGGVFLLEELGRGAAGAMTGYAFPEALVEIYTAYRAGDQERARAVFFHHLPLIRFEAQVGIGLGIRKEILRRRGALRTALVRAPAPTIDAHTWQELDALLTCLEVLPLAAG